MSRNTLLQNNFTLGASFGVVKIHIRAAHVTQETSWPYSRCQQQQPALMNTDNNTKLEFINPCSVFVVLLASFNCLKRAPLIYLPNTSFDFAPLSNNEKQSRNAERPGSCILALPNLERNVWTTEVEQAVLGRRASPCGQRAASNTSDREAHDVSSDLLSNLCLRKCPHHKVCTLCASRGAGGVWVLPGRRRNKGKTGCWPTKSPN